MEVIMKTLSAGPAGVVSPGERVTVSKKQAEALVGGGFGQYETAAVEIPEKREDASQEEAPKSPEPEKPKKAKKRGKKRSKKN